MTDTEAAKALLSQLSFYPDFFNIPENDVALVTAALHARMTWTSAKPTVPGWYWHRGNETGVDIVTVAKVIDHITGDIEFSAYIDNQWLLLEQIDGEWAGPLEPPA